MAEFLTRFLKGELGSKTVLAAVVLVALVIANAAGWVSADQFNQYVRVAEGLGLIGLRDAIAKLKG